MKRKNPVFRYRKDCPVTIREKLNLLGNGKRITSECKALHIEGLCHERLLAQEKQVTCCICHIGTGMQQDLVVCAVKRTDTNKISFGRSGLGCLDTKQVVFAIGKEPWPTMTYFLPRAIQFGNNCWGSACRRDA